MSMSVKKVYITAIQMPSVLMWVEVLHVPVTLVLKEMESLVQVNTKIADLAPSIYQVLYFTLFCVYFQIQMSVYRVVLCVIPMHYVLILTEDSCVSACLVLQEMEIQPATVSSFMSLAYCLFAVTYICVHI